MADPERPIPAHSFRCAGCAAELRYDAATGDLRCAHCGAASAVEGPAEEIVAQALADGLRQAPKGLGAGPGTRTCRCRECGASVSFPDVVIATRCTFCGSARVLEEAENLNAIRPGALLPFSIERRRAEDAFRAWLRRRWLAPRDLRRAALLEGLGGVYVPYWCFDAHVESRWSARSGRYRRDADDRYTIQGGPDLPRPRKARRVREIRWTRERGRRSDAFSGLLVSASHGLPRDLADRLVRYKLGELVPYAPGYLAGWRAEAYAVDLPRGYELARQRMLAAQRARCAGDVPGDLHRDLQVASAISAVTWKHLLLPVWVAAYRYRGRAYQLLVNGQSGEIVGRAPWSVLKLALLGLALAVLLAVLYRYR